MKIVIIGSGNVATVLGRLVQKKGHQVVQVFSRDAEHARELARILDCGYTDNHTELAPGADIYLLAVSDNALYTLQPFPSIDGKLVLHTAGSVPMDVIRPLSVNYGVLYPLQSLRKEMEPSEDIPLLVDGNTPDVTAFIKDFASSLSGIVSRADDEERLKLHVAAVIVSNFTNHLYALAEDFCKKEEVEFRMLLPLVRETANRLTQYSPSAVQTGPAIRNDIFTLDKHLRILTSHPRLKYVYLKLTDSIMSR